MVSVCKKGIKQMAKDTIVIDSFDIPLSSNDETSKSIAIKLAELKISAKAVFSITTFRSIGATWYTVWYKRCKKCKCGSIHTTTGA